MQKGQHTSTTRLNTSDLLKWCFPRSRFVDFSFCSNNVHHLRSKQESARDKKHLVLHKAHKPSWRNQLSPRLQHPRWIRLIICGRTPVALCLSLAEQTQTIIPTSMTFRRNSAASSFSRKPAVQCLISDVFSWQTYLRVGRVFSSDLRWDVQYAKCHFNETPQKNPFLDERTRIKKGR